jgi:hypothetical protein
MTKTLNLFDRLTLIIAQSPTFNPFVAWGRMHFQQPHEDRNIAWRFDSWKQLPIVKGKQGRSVSPNHMGGKGTVSMIENQDPNSPLFI